MESVTSTVVRISRGRRDETRDCFGKFAALSTSSGMGFGRGVNR
jgi:hypothetical protein